MLIIGIDPSLTCTGWGIVAKSGNRLTHVANGQVKTDAALPLADRLVTLDRELTDVILRHRPDSGAVEEVFVNKNPQSTLKLGHARGLPAGAGPCGAAGPRICHAPRQEGDRRHRRGRKGAGPGDAEGAAARREAGRGRRG